MTKRLRSLDQGLRLIPERVGGRLWIVAAAWFITLSAIRLSVLVPSLPGYDGMLYRAATLRWLAGGDPWAVQPDMAAFGAPPPTLLAMLPFAMLPEVIARIALVGLGIAASVWLIRRLRLPIWWLAFPPLVDGLYIGNPHVFVVPLIVAGFGPLAVFAKVYAGAIPALLLRWRTLFVTAVLFVVTAPFLPWGAFIAQWPAVSAALASQSGGGGLSVLATPILLPIALVAAVVIGRESRAWWAVPVFWPYTQWYYASMVLPVATPLAAMALAMPIPGATTLAIVLAAAESLHRRRLLRRARADTPGPLRTGGGGSAESA
ncbi:MAG: hypothetical protein NVS9B8_02950 [Candidatus Limnocylindrales bacterium]